MSAAADFFVIGDFPQPNVSGMVRGNFINLSERKLIESDRPQCDRISAAVSL
jgi:hypothetical protein